MMSLLEISKKYDIIHKKYRLDKNEENLNLDK